MSKGGVLSFHRKQTCCPPSPCAISVPLCLLHSHTFEVKSTEASCEDPCCYNNRPRESIFKREIEVLDALEESQLSTTLLCSKKTMQYTKTLQHVLCRGLLSGESVSRFLRLYSFIHSDLKVTVSDIQFCPHISGWFSSSPDLGTVNVEWLSCWLDVVFA